MFLAEPLPPLAAPECLTLHVHPCSWVHACLGRAESGAAGLPPEDSEASGQLLFCASMPTPFDMLSVAHPYPTHLQPLQPTSVCDLFGVCMYKELQLLCPPSPADFSLSPTDSSSLQGWPWQLHPTEPSSSLRTQEGRPQRAGASAGLSPVSRGRRRGTAAVPARAAGHRGPPAARPLRATRAAADAPGGIASGDGQEASEGSAGEAQAVPPQRAGRFARRGGGATRRAGAATRAASRAAPVPPAAAAEPGPPAADEASAAPPGVGPMPEAINTEAAGGGALQQEQAAAPRPAPTSQARSAPALPSSLTFIYCWLGFVVLHLPRAHN